MDATRKHGGAHAGARTYVIIFVVLFAVTATEVGILYVRLPALAAGALLTILSVVKFSLVVLFFMHLYFDGRLLTLLFLSGLGMAVMTVAGVNAMFMAPSLQPQGPFKPPLRPADARNGPAVFVKATCVVCHTVKSVPQARGNIGPVLDGIGTRAATRRAGLSSEAYIRESIESPAAFIVPGYQNMMPGGVRGMMTDQEYEDLVAWLQTL